MASRGHHMQHELILASGSPRRREILTTLGLAFRVLCPAADESLPDGISPAAAVELLAARKAKAALEIAGEEPVILAADTVVALEEERCILGKPADEAEAAAMLRLLSGREHAVFTGVALRRGKREMVAHQRTLVRFAPLDETDIADYIATGEPADKAGAYAIQGRAARFIEGIAGDYFNVVGLPANRTWEMLRRFGAL